MLDFDEVKAATKPNNPQLPVPGSVGWSLELRV